MSEDLDLLEWVVADSHRLAKVYVSLVEALMMQGVEEEWARQEARSVVMALILDGCDG